MPVIALLNESSLDDAEVAFMAAAVDLQLREDVLPKWLGVDYTPLTFFSSAKDLPVASGSDRLMIIKDTIDQPTAAGYHSFEGVPMSRILAQGTQTSVTISHEAIEMLLDPQADRWVKMPDGREVAFEGCDPVEGTSYLKTVTMTEMGLTRQVPVSAFVGPEWFQPGSPGAFTLSPGGYMIVLAADGKVEDVWARMEDGEAASAAIEQRRAQKAANPSSRFNRRGVRVAPF